MTNGTSKGKFNLVSSKKRMDLYRSTDGKKVKGFKYQALILCSDDVRVHYAKVLDKNGTIYQINKMELR